MRVEQKEIQVDVTAAAGAQGPVISLEHIYGFSAILNCLAAQVGALKFQVSNDDENTLKQKPASAVWFDLPSGDFTVNGAAVQGGNFDAQYYRWLRVYYTKTSGAGTLQVLLNLKGA